MRAPRLVLLAAGCGAAHGAARAFDAGLGLALHTSLDAPRLGALAARLVEPQAALVSASAFALAAGAVAVGLGGRGGPQPMLALLLRPLLSLLAWAAVAFDPAYPYFFTLPVALTQDLAPAQDVLALAIAVAALARAPRVPTPRPAELGLLAFLAYVLLTPGWAWQWDNHPGNEPKTLRMALALGHFGSLDTEPVSAAMEALPTRPMAAMVAGAATTVVAESARMAAAFVEGGPAALGSGAIRATRVARQTIRGKDGGVFHVLAPGPSLLLAPTLRLDRAINLERGTPGRVAVSVALFCALAAALVAAVQSLVSEASGRPGAAGALAGLFALLPPFAFYPYQFYPEMLGTLALALLWRFVIFGRGWSGAALAGHALLLAFVPWLHQKFLPLWGVLALHAGLVAVWRMVSLRALCGLVVPQVVSVFLYALWNFAITGSARPDAVFLAWGPGGVTAARIGEGLAGLALDLRYGLLPWVPLYLFGLAGLALPKLGRLRLALPSALVYYFTVAAADNWSGAVCMLGRYAMPVTPLVVAGLGVLLARAGARRGLLALALAAAGWSALLAVPLHRDPHAANDCALLAAKSALAEPALYVPSLFSRTPGSELPIQRGRTAAWLLALAGLAWFARRAASGTGACADHPLAAAGVAVALILGAAFVAERLGEPRRAPAWPDALESPGGTTVFTGPVLERAGRTAVVGPGAVAFLLRAREPLSAFRVHLAGASGLRAAGRAPVPLLAAGAPVDASVELLAEVVGRGGAREWLYRLPLSLTGGPRIEIRFDGGRSAAASNAGG